MRESRENKGGGGRMRKEGGKVRMSNGEGWDDRRRAHSDGVGVGIKGQNRHHTHYCSSMVFVEWV